MLMKNFTQIRAAFTAGLETLSCIGTNELLLHVYLSLDGVLSSVRSDLKLMSF